MPLRRLALAISLGVATVLALAQEPRATPAAPNLPTLGDTEREALSPAMERKLGEEIMLDMRREHDFIDDGPVLEYLNNFGTALVAASPEVRGETRFDFFFFAVRDTQLNAFALPGGFIAVHSALLLAARSESELASVLAHEIGHVAQRHIARMLGQQRQDFLIPLASIVLAILASRAGGDAAMGVVAAGQGLALQRQLNFSRDAEREADRIGFQIMSEAGFDASGMVAFFGRLQAASRSYSDLTPAWLKSHPLTTERIADIAARIRAMPYRQRADSLDFSLVQARVLVLQDDSAQGLHNARATFQNQLLQHSGKQLAAAYYGLALLALKQGAVGLAQSNLDAANNTLIEAPLRQSAASATTAGADSSYGSAARIEEPNAILSSMAIEIKLAASKQARSHAESALIAQQALQQAQAAHLQFPLSRAMAQLYAVAMLAAQHFDEAERYLRDQVQLYRQEPKLDDLLAQAYAAQGKIALQHMALAESYVLNGGTLTALDQLALARKAVDASFYDMSMIDARERQLQARRRDEIAELKAR